MRANNLVYLHRDRGYRFNEPDSLLYHVRIAINDASMSSNALSECVHRETGETVMSTTIDNLMNGRTQKPHLRTVRLIMLALGYHLCWRR